MRYLITQSTAQQLFLSVICFAAFFFILTFFTHAHGTGASLETVRDGILIDIGYDPVDITARVPVSFDFNLYSADTAEEIPYASVWVRIYTDRNIFYAGGIHRSLVGATTMLFQFENPGTYTLSVRFENEAGSIVEEMFEIPVSGSVSSHASIWQYVFYAGLIVVGLLAGIFSARYLRTHRSTASLSNP